MFVQHLIISAFLHGQTPQASVPFSHAIRAYGGHRLARDAQKPEILHGEIIPPEPGLRRAFRPDPSQSRRQALDELDDIAGGERPTALKTIDGEIIGNKHKRGTLRFE